MPIFASASPSVSGVAGTIANGNPLTISGTAFTAITTTTLNLDQMESGAIDSVWQSHNNLGITTANQRHAFSVYSSSLNITSNSVGNGFVQGNNSFVSRDWFSSFWLYLGSDWDWGTTTFSGTDKFLSNIKFPARYWNPGAASENFYFAYDGWADAIEAHWEGYTQQPIKTAIANARSVITLGVWHHFQMEFRDSSGLNQFDGKATLWMDGTLYYSTTSMRFKEAENLNKRLQVLGVDNVWNCTEDGGGGVDTAGCQAPNSLYIDDIYNWDSLARVEVSTCSSYSGCQREIQKPTSWSDNSIVVTFNEGSLSGTKYIYVTDNNGITSSGYNLSGGAGSAKSIVCPAGTGHP